MNRRLTSLKISNKNTSEILYGYINGAERLSIRYAIENKIKINGSGNFKPNYKKFGKLALVKRNHNIIKRCDIAILFWDGISKETQHNINLLKAAKKQYFLYRY